MQVVELGRSQAIAEQGFGEKGVPTRREIGPGAVLYDPEHCQVDKCTQIKLQTAPSRECTYIVSSLAHIKLCCTTLH